jgi:hypothetical protein
MPIELEILYMKLIIKRQKKIEGWAIFKLCNLEVAARRQNDEIQDRSTLYLSPHFRLSVNAHFRLTIPGVLTSLQLLDDIIARIISGQLKEISRLSRDSLILMVPSWVDHSSKCLTSHL